MKQRAIWAIMGAGAVTAFYCLILRSIGRDLDRSAVPTEPRTIGFRMAVGDPVAWHVKR